MKKIIDEFGQSIIAMLAVVATLGIVVTAYTSGGIVSDAAVTFLSSITG